MWRDARGPDSNTPTWENNLTGHINLRDANRRTINYAANGKQYRLNSKVSTLIVRYMLCPCSSRGPGPNRTRARARTPGRDPAQTRTHPDPALNPLTRLGPALTRP